MHHHDRFVVFRFGRTPADVVIRRQTSSTRTCADAVRAVDLEEAKIPHRAETLSNTVIAAALRLVLKSLPRASVANTRARHMGTCNQNTIFNLQLSQ